MKTLASIALASALFAGSALAADGARKVTVHFPAGSTGTTISDRITGDEWVEYSLGASNGQFLTVSVSADNPSTGFNVYIPGKGPGDEALYNSEMGGSMEYTGQLYVSGNHVVSVFLNRNAARGGQTSNYDIRFEIE